MYLVIKGTKNECTMNNSMINEFGILKPLNIIEIICRESTLMPE